MNKGTFFTKNLHIPKKSSYFAVDFGIIKRKLLK